MSFNERQKRKPSDSFPDQGVTCNVQGIDKMNNKTKFGKQSGCESEYFMSVCKEGGGGGGS